MGSRVFINLLKILFSGNGSYVLEYCGETDGHVWKALEPIVEEADGVYLPNAELDEIALDLPSVPDDTFVSVSVKFYYTAEFANTTSDIDGFLDQVIAETNQGFENSGINMQVFSDSLHFKINKIFFFFFLGF